MPSVLIADDNPASLRFLSEAARSQGVECAEASDGDQALALARAQRFDLLILDWQMPRTNGPRALAAIRADPDCASRDAPAIATTADTQPSARESLLAAGFSALLLKPCTIDHMRQLLQTYIPSLKPESESPRPLDQRSGERATGDPAILIALRRLLCDELESLPGELEARLQAGDFPAIRASLHRLRASAGFCGAPELSAASERLREALDACAESRSNAWNEFVATCRRLRVELQA